SSRRCGRSTAPTSTHASSCGGFPRPAHTCSKARGRTPAPSISAMAGRWCSRSRATIIRRSSSPSRARPPGWAASCRTSSPRARRPTPPLGSLRSGDPADPRTRRLIDGVVSGISWYGNCFGCPTVGGEMAFAPDYAGNPLVNVMCVGLVRADRIFRARADGVGNPVFYVGNKTGRDGIHGATMASGTFDEHAHERRPTVQVGDPFTEKLLLEACLEAMASGAVVGIQDMGAAGLACCTSEMPARSRTGMEVELDRVPQREIEMTPYEILLSESQERMLLVAARGREAE